MLLSLLTVCLVCGKNLVAHWKDLAILLIQTIHKLLKKAGRAFGEIFYFFTAFSFNHVWLYSFYSVLRILKDKSKT